MHLFAVVMLLTSFSRGDARSFRAGASLEDRLAPEAVEDRRPWHPRLAAVSRADGTVGLQRREALTVVPSLLQVKSRSGPGICDCKHKAPTTSGHVAVPDAAAPALSAMSKAKPVALVQQHTQDAEQNQRSTSTAEHEQQVAAMRAVESNMQAQQGQLQQEMIQIQMQQQMLQQQLQQQQMLPQPAQQQLPQQMVPNQAQMQQLAQMQMQQQELLREEVQQQQMQAYQAQMMNIPQPSLVFAQQPPMQASYPPQAQMLQTRQVLPQQTAFIQGAQFVGQPMQVQQQAQLPMQQQAIMPPQAAMLQTNQMMLPTVPQMTPNVFQQPAFVQGAPWQNLQYR